MQLKQTVIALLAFCLLLLPTFACDWSDCGPISEAMDQVNNSLNYYYNLKDAGEPVNQEDIDVLVSYAEQLQGNWQILCQAREGG